MRVSSRPRAPGGHRHGERHSEHPAPRFRGHRRPGASLRVLRLGDAARAVVGERRQRLVAGSRQGGELRTERCLASSSRKPWFPLPRQRSNRHQAPRGRHPAAVVARGERGPLTERPTDRRESPCTSFQCFVSRKPCDSGLPPEPMYVIRNLCIQDSESA